eukprot:TRINITY_DN1199_c0_g1_i1.p1 TRINITY_DN1199_c0_g1~~TRINITY_DN1199_c0_g1_i1.p1  ORF type:complete len:395 (-),score=59.68 TRINITY_DN1199_c0_g1_i1:127-1311(-)
MANVFVDFASAEDISTELARLASLNVSKDASEKFFEDAQKLVQDGKSTELLTKVFSESNSLLSQLSEKDAEAFFLVAFSTLKKLSADVQQPIVSELISVLTSNAEEKVQLRLKLLNHAYNVLNSVPAVRFALFQAILKYAVASHAEESVANVHADLDRLAKTWDASPDQLREVYRLIRDIFRNRKQAKVAHEWTLKYLAFFKDEADSGLAATSEEAVRCIVEAINLPGLYSFDALAELLPIKRLQQSNAAAWNLLSVFVSGTLDDYRRSLTPANLEQFTAAGLDEQASESKIRCLTLATLGSQSNQVPYSTVATALQVDESEVESYVVTAISDSVIDARLDQLRRHVSVSRTIQRQFGRAQWAQLNETLQAWKSNVKAILQSIEAVKDQSVPQH